MNPKNFFGELKRRNVYKVAVAYAIVGWLLVQITTQVFPFLEIPTWVVRLVIALVAIGFPVALVIAWAFEATPEGIKRTEDVDLPAGRASKNRTWIYVVVIGAAFSIGLFFIGRYTARNATSVVRTELPSKSIAVLPFDNLSRDPDNAYFAEGVQDEILTRLASVADLKVISRTSTRKYKSARKTCPRSPAIDYFNQAIEKDPNYALAYAGLADAWLVLPLFGGGAPKDCSPKAETAARRAIHLDETVAEPHASLGLLLAIYYFDFSSSIRELERAIQLNPNYAMAHHWLGNLPLTFTGQFDRAIGELKRALELDPLSMIINANLGQTYCYSRRYEEAIPQLHRTIEIDPSFYYAHYQLGEALEFKGNRDAAIAEYQQARELNDDPLVLALLAHAMAKAGNPAQARKVLEQLKEESRHRYVTAYGIGLVYLGLGENEEALRWFEKSYQDRAGTEIGYIKVDPLLDDLRGNPRFEALVQKIVGGKQ